MLALPLFERIFPIECTYESGGHIDQLKQRKQYVNNAHLSRKQHCPHRVHYAADNSTEHCRKNPSPEKADKLWALTGKMYHVDLLSHCLVSTLRHSNSAAL